jgi:hypothetical protein
MKRSILIILCVLLSYNLYAQEEKDYIYYSHQIDSLVLAYSVEKPSGGGGRYFFHSKDDTITTKEKKKLIYKVKKMFEQKEYTNLYYLGHELIYNMYWYHTEDNPIEIKQILMELFLQYYFYPGKGYSIVDSYNLQNRFDNTKKAKKRIIEILENKKTEEEFELYLKYEKSLPLAYVSMSWEDAARIMKKREQQDSTIFKQIRDSLLNDYIYRNVKEEFESAQIEPELIKMIGLLDMKECIPILKQKLAHCIEKDCLYGQEKAYRYALARLGDVEQRQYILDNLMDIGVFDRRDFSYFQDDEMIWKYIEVNRHSKTLVYTDSESQGVSASFMSIEYIYPYIKNLPKDKDLEYPDSRYMDAYFQWAQLFYEWLMKNKESVVFDYDGEKAFHW